MYAWAALNTEEIGYYIAIALSHLIKTYPIENIHLIGNLRNPLSRLALFNLMFEIVL